MLCSVFTSDTSFRSSQCFGDQCMDDEKLVENTIRQEQSKAHVTNAGLEGM